MMTASGRVDHHPSPNHGPRAEGSKIDILLLHYTGMPSSQKALDWLCNPQSRASSHYLVFEDGRICQMVDESERAWHAGKSCWAGETDINSRSIGIELGNPGHEFGYTDYPARQIDAVITLCRAILSRNPIPPERVLAHSDVAPTRKQDPGERFPWQKLHAAGIGHWAVADPIVPGAAFKLGDAGNDVLRLKRRFRKYGYGVSDNNEYDEETAAVVRAFQRHFRPALIDGIADVSTLGTLERLSDALRRKEMSRRTILLTGRQQK
jgi:N-acetylmuramoyl-L-alanine amidase